MIQFQVVSKFKPKPITKDHNNHKRYIITMAITVGACIVMLTHYKNQTGKDKIKQLLAQLHNMAEKGMCVDKYNFPNEPECMWIGENIGILEKTCLSDIKSYQTYISFLIGVHSELLMIFERFKSKKCAVIKDVINKLEEIYVYYSSRNKIEEYDKKAFELIDLFNLTFNYGG